MKAADINTSISVLCSSKISQHVEFKQVLRESEWSGGVFWCCATVSTQFRVTTTMFVEQVHQAKGSDWVGNGHYLPVDQKETNHNVYGRLG